MRTIFLIVFAFIFISPNFAIASEPPQLLSPPNESEVTSSKVTWQIPSYSLYPNSPYNIEVDNNPDFSSPEKDYSTNNTSYSPQLNPGLWYWRVRAKDSQGSWSNFSSSWSFTLQTETPKPTSTSAPTSNEKPSSDTKPYSQFTISSIPSEINSNESFEVEIVLELPSNPNSFFYLKGAFKGKDSSNYFGQTFVSNSWVKNNAKYSEQLKITTDRSGKYSEKIKIMPDSEDSGFDGSEDYIFKVARYTSTGSGPTWSNEKQIKIIKVLSKTTQDNEPSITTSTTPKPTLTTKLASATKAATSIAEVNQSTISPQIAGIATDTPEVEIESQRSINWWAIGGGVVFLLIGVGLVVKFIHDKKQSNKSFN